jgi:hypothetical protein
VGAETKVGSMTECEVVVWAPLNIKSVWLLKLPLVSVGGSVPNANMVAGLDRLTVDFSVSRAHTGKLDHG